MDDLFAKPTRRRDDSSIGSSASAEGRHVVARHMVQQMQDIVLDEASDVVSLSPDEKRLRGAGKGRRHDADSWDAALEEASKIADEDEGFVDVGGGDGAVDDLFGQHRPQKPAAKPLADGLFSKRRAPAEDEDDEAGQNRAQGDDLFFRKKVNPDAPPPLGDLFTPKKQEEPDDDDDDDEDEEDAEDEDAAESGVGIDSKAGCCLKCVRCCEKCIPERCLVTCSTPFPSRDVLAKFGGVALLIAAALAVITIALATGCDAAAPFGRVCILEGPVQWIVALSPVTLFFSAAFYWFRYSYKAKVVTQAAAWQHDVDAQHSAAELLDTLAMAPAGERHKYAGQAVQVLKDFPDKAIIQYKGCMALEAICRAQRGNVQHVNAAGAVPTILLALDKHLRVRKVQSSGLSALACLAKLGKRQIFELGGIETILRSMTKFKRDPTIQVSGSMAIGALCLSSLDNRKSVARYGGVSVLLQAVERHVERADVIIACSETLALIGADSAGLQKQLLASLPVIQGIVERYEMARRTVTTEKGVRDCDIVLRSLRKLEARLNELGEVEEDDAASDVATPRLDTAQESNKVVQGNNQKATELMGRLHQWKEKT